MSRARRPRSKLYGPPGSHCICRCCLSNIRTSRRRQRRDKREWQAESHHRAYGRQNQWGASAAATSARADMCVCAAEGMRASRDTRETETDLLKQWDGGNYNYASNYTWNHRLGVREEEIERGKKSTGGKEPGSESHPCNYSMRTKWNGGRTHTYHAGPHRVRPGRCSVCAQTWVCLHHLHLFWVRCWALLTTSLTYSWCHHTHWLKSLNPPKAYDPCNELDGVGGLRGRSSQVMTTSWLWQNRPHTTHLHSFVNTVVEPPEKESLSESRRT